MNINSTTSASTSLYIGSSGSYQLPVAYLVDYVVLRKTQNESTGRNEYKILGQSRILLKNQNDLEFEVARMKEYSEYSRDELEIRNIISISLY